MTKKVYRKTNRKHVKRMVRFTSLGVSLVGLMIGLYIFFPVISWELYVKPAFASSSFASPIPKHTIITKNYLKSLLSNTASSFSGVNYNNAANWVPSSYNKSDNNSPVPSYTISIPKIGIEDATVSTVDTDLTSHLVHFPGTAIPPERGTAAIFGHSTLPHLFDRDNYKTIFANIHEVTLGDTIIASVNNTLYTYKIFSIEITDPEDSSYLTQSYDSSYLYIITCTPPGTTWKRLIVKSRLEKF
jgi:sortase A